MHILGDSEYFKWWPVLKAISVEEINIKLSGQVEKGEKIIPSYCYILCCFVIYIKCVYLCRSVWVCMCMNVYAQSHSHHDVLEAGCLDLNFSLTTSYLCAIQRFI